MATVADILTFLETLAPASLKKAGSHYDLPILLSIAAASILAKVSRDRYVVDVLDKQYPEYQFAKHKGYGTALHKELYLKYGPCPEHRLTFLKKWEAEQ